MNASLALAKHSPRGQNDGLIGVLAIEAGFRHHVGHEGLWWRDWVLPSLKAGVSM